MSTGLNYRTARLRQAEYLPQAEETRRANDVVGAASAPSLPNGRLRSTGRRRCVAVKPSARLRAHEPMGCDR